MADCLFCRIVAGEIPATIAHETPSAIVFHDIHPKAPVHLLAIPKEHYDITASIAEADPKLAGEVLAAATEAAAKADLTGGYRLLANTGADAGMEVSHFHVHVLGGRPLGPMVAPQK